MNNHMSLKLVGANSSLEINSPITSIYLQEELTGLTTLPGIRETKGMNIGMDGGWTSAQFYEPRLITIKGVIANQDVAVVEQRRKQLIQLLAEKRLALEFQTEAGNHYTMNVVVAGVQMPLSKVLTASYFQLSLRADDPLIYDNNALAELEAILRRSSSASSGFSINFPINFQLGVSESRPTIDNFGSSVIYPVITLTGPLTTPEIVNITTNMAFTIDEVLGAGTYTASGIRGAMTQEGSVDTYSGNPIQATRDAESPISKFSLYGDATQQTYSGKNLVNQGQYGTNISNYGLTASFTSEEVTLTGTSQASTWPSYVMYADGHLEPARYWPAAAAVATSRGQFNGEGTYRFTIYTDGTRGSESNDFRYIIGYMDGTVENKYFPLADKSQNISITKPINFIAFGAEPSIAFNLKLKFQLEAGSTATSFEKFVGGSPAPNPDYPQPVNTVTGEQTVKITGKNLFDKDNANIINVIPTNTELAYYANARALYIAIEGGKTYTFSRGNNTNQVGDWAYAFTTTTPTSGTPVIDGKHSIGGSNLVFTFTAPSTANYLVFNFAWQKSAEVVNTILSTYQLELGSTATAYQPYQGQEYEVNLGKNLIQNTLITEPTEKNGVTATPNADGTFTLNGTATANGYFNFYRDGTILTASTYVTDIGSTIKSATTGNFTYSASITNGRIYSLAYDNSNRYWFFVTKSGETYNNAILKIQCEAGTSATSYAPYFTPIELAKIGNYQDRIYKTDGKWYIEKQVGKVVLDGSADEGWASQTGSHTTILNLYVPTNSWGIKTGTLPVLCSIASYSTNAGGSNDTYANICKANPTLPFFLLDLAQSDFATLADFKTWLASNPTTVYYALATPTTTEITNSELIDQLDAILEAHLYEGLNNISNVTISPNLAGDLEIKTGQTLTVINSLSIVGSSGTAEIDLGGSELAMVGSVADELTINGTTGAVTKTTRIGKIESYAGETITTDYISTSGGLDSDATIYYVLPSSSTSVINTLDSTALTAFNNVVASGGVSAQTNIGSISVDVTTVTAQDVAVVDTKQHTVTINGVGAYSKFSGDWLTLDVGLNELQLITENNTDTGSAVIKYRVGYMGV